MSSPITGRTRILGIVGDPVQQVRAPAVWTPLFRRNGIDAVCVPMHVSPANFESFIEAASSIQNLIGMIVTVPHKPAAASVVQRLTDRAQAVGAVNVLRWDTEGASVGDITDGVGFVRGMKASGIELANRRVLVVGAGGVGNAIARAIADAGANEVSVSDIQLERAQRLCSRIRASGTRSEVVQGAAHSFDVVVNATPIGMRTDDPLPFDCDGLTPATVVADVIMAPAMTRLLTVAKERGCVIHQGMHMMDHSIHEMARFFGLGGDNWSAEAASGAADQY